MPPELPKLNVKWDTNTAVAVLVLGALGFLIALRHGFRPVLVS